MRCILPKTVIKAGVAGVAEVSTVWDSSASRKILSWTMYQITLNELYKDGRIMLEV